MSSGPLYIVVAACLGYAFCQRCHVLRYAIARKSGWYAYLHVTSFGGLVLLCGALLQRESYGHRGVKGVSRVSIRCFAEGSLVGHDKFGDHLVSAVDIKSGSQ